MNDTDSIIYIRDPDGYNIPEGSLLGEWEIEKPCALNGGIKTFVGLGPKTYAFTTWKQDYKVHTVVKAKGLTLNHATSDLVNFEVMEKMVIDFLEMEERPDKRTVQGIKVPQMGFCFSFDSDKGMRSVKTLKELKINPKEMKGVLIGALLYPFGHEKAVDRGQ